MPGWASWLFARAADDLRGQHSDGAVVQGAAERARGEHVQRAGDQRAAVLHRGHARMPVPDPVDRPRVDIADHHFRPGLGEMIHQARAHLADALDPDPPALQAGAAPGVLGRRPHALEYAERGQHRRIARAAVRHGATGHVTALPRDDVHVLAVRADVTRRDVAPAEGLDEPAVGAQQRLGLQRAGIADDHGLPAAQVKPGQGALVSHRPGQVEHVGQGLRLTLVRVEAGAAQRGTQRRGVDRDDGPQPGRGVLAEDDLLVPGVIG